MLEMPKYYNYNYNDCKYYEVSGPGHDHYTYKYETNSWYEDIIKEELPIKVMKQCDLIDQGKRISRIIDASINNRNKLQELSDEDLEYIHDALLKYVAKIIQEGDFEWN